MSEAKLPAAKAAVPAPAEDVVTEVARAAENSGALKTLLASPLGKWLAALGMMLGGLVYAKSGINDRLDKLEAKVDVLAEQVTKAMKERK